MGLAKKLEILKSMFEPDIDLDKVERCRAFKPTVRETLWGKKITWEMRDKPLTREEMEELFGEEVINKIFKGL